MPERYLGKTLGRYRVEELVGSGGFAWVYRGFDPELEIPVALKVLKPQFAGDHTFEERFRREASTAAKLRHPNIIKIYAVGRDRDAVYFAMDYLPSGLAEKLEAASRLAEEFVVQLGIDVARALGFAHREGVIHRDIKVDNILFDAHGNAVVADFGIARAVSGYTQQTGTNMVVGTPQYFAPEQARAKPLDGRADIYSLGVSLYRSATGRLPFEGDDWYEIARQHVEDPPPSPRKLNPALSVPFERLVLRCLAKHVDDRPATGEQLADELAVVLHNARESGGASTAVASSGSHRSFSGSRAAYISPSESPTLITPLDARLAGGMVARRLRSRAAPVVLVLVALGAGAVAFLARRPSAPVAAPPTPAQGPPTRPDSVVASSPSPITGPDSTSSDSSPRTSSGAAPVRRDTSRSRPVSAVISPSRLVVSVPANARVTVNGVAVATGPWRADTLKPGDYAIAVAIPAPSGCESATAETTVRLRAATTREVTLAPRPCGTVDISLLNVLGTGARYSIASADGGVKRDGTLPLGAPLVLPAGQYRVIAQQPLCVAYDNDAVNVTADRSTRLAFRLVCDRE